MAAPRHVATAQCQIDASDILKINIYLCSQTDTQILSGKNRHDNHGNSNIMLWVWTAGRAVITGLGCTKGRRHLTVAPTGWTATRRRTAGSTITTSMSGVFDIHVTASVTDLAPENTSTRVKWQQVFMQSSVVFKSVIRTKLLYSSKEAKTTPRVKKTCHPIYFIFLLSIDQVLEFFY